MATDMNQATKATQQAIALLSCKLNNDTETFDTLLAGYANNEDSLPREIVTLLAGFTNVSLVLLNIIKLFGMDQLTTLQKLSIECEKMAAKNSQGDT